MSLLVLPTAAKFAFLVDSEAKRVGSTSWQRKMSLHTATTVLQESQEALLLGCVWSVGWFCQREGDPWFHQRHLLPAFWRCSSSFLGVSAHGDDGQLQKLLYSIEYH